MTQSTFISILFILCINGLKGQTDSTIYSIPMLDKRPMWIGCETDSCTENHMFSFIVNNLKYPNRHDYVGNIFIQFVIEKDGTKSNIIVKKGVEKRLDDEALRLIQIMPDFIPGYLNEKPVRCRFTIPINFSLF
jgi:TonB family protein